MLKLHHAWASTCSQKVRLCLEEKGLDWQGRAWNLRALEHLSDEFLALNPAGMVPVLEHDGLVIPESSVINEYLEDAFPERPLLPADAAGRARVRAWVKFIDDVPTDAIKVPSYQRNLRDAVRALTGEQQALIEQRMPNRKTADRWLRIARTDRGLDPAELADAMAKLTATLARMREALARHAWLAGETYTLADVNMTPFVDRLGAFEEFDLDRDWPEVARWLRAVRARPAYRAAKLVDQRTGGSA